MYFVESGIVFMKCEYYTKVWACWIDSSTGYCCVQLHAERTLSRVEAGFPPKSPLRNQLQLLLHHILKFHSPVASWAASISVQIEDRSVCCWNWFLRSGLLISCRSKEPLQWRRDWGRVWAEVRRVTRGCWQSWQLSRSLRIAFARVSIWTKHGLARRLGVLPGTTARLTAGDLGRGVQASSPPPSAPLAHPHQPP